MSGGSSIPQTKTARHEAIRALLAAEAILDLNDRALRHVVIGMGGKAHGVPRETGFDITVASEMMAILCLSRDLMDMRATKIRDARGALVYTVPDVDGGPTHEAEAAHARLARWCQNLLVTSVAVGNQLVLRTPVGAANLLGSALDAVRLDGVAGTIAGDDTILVICRAPEEARAVERRLLAEPGAAPEG